MSKEFIEQRLGSASIDLAIKQQEQLAYFTQSEIQKDITEDYINTWVNRKYAVDGHFLNWVKSVFKTDNFLSFYKYYRNPNPASKLINSRIKEPLSRVFFAEDSYFNYTIRGKKVENPEECGGSFENDLFNALLFRHNDIIIHDLEEINKPYREFLSMDKVISIKSSCGKIERLAYSAETTVDGIVYKGYAYMDAERYMFYDKDYVVRIDVAHDLGECPAEYVSKEVFANDDVVRKSIFSYVREELEEYNFLKTLQKMTEPNGSIPVVTKLKTKEKNASGQDIKGLEKEPMSLKQLGSQASKQRSGVDGNGSVLQTGSIIEVPVNKKLDGSIDVTFAKNLLTFFYLPVEAMEYLSKRIKEIEQSIIVSILGDYSEGNESAKNEMQVSKSYVSKEDMLRWVSSSLSKARKGSDYKLLALKYGAKSVQVDIFYGSDFFLQTEEELYDMFKKSPNAIERKNILNRLAQSRNKFNPTKAQREVVLYKMLPYASDEDFKLAIENQAVDPATFQLQTRFTYWVAQFEANYGSMVSFWNDMEATDSAKLVTINNLLYDLINSTINLTTLQNEKKANSTPASV